MKLYGEEINIFKHQNWFSGKGFKKKNVMLCLSYYFLFENLYLECTRKLWKINFAKIKLFY